MPSAATDSREPACGDAIGDIGGRRACPASAGCEVGGSSSIAATAVDGAALGDGARAAADDVAVGTLRVDARALPPSNSVGVVRPLRDVASARGAADARDAGGD
jgi:hypothetical protein